MNHLPVQIGSLIRRRRFGGLPPSHRPDWWGPIWRGLAVEPTGKHYRAMRASLWLYVYLVIHADRRTGALSRLLPTISRDMGVKPRTVRQWLSILKKGGYVTTTPTGRALRLAITKWKPLRGAVGNKERSAPEGEIASSGDL